MSLKNILKDTINPESKTAIRNEVVEIVLSRIGSTDIIQGMHDEAQKPKPTTNRRQNDDTAYHPRENRGRTLLLPSNRATTRSKSRDPSKKIKEKLRSIITDIVDNRFPDASGTTSARSLMYNLNESDIINGELCYLCKCPILSKYHADHKIPSTMSFLCGFDQIQLNRHSSRYRHITTFNSYDRDDQNLNLHETTMAPTHPICNIIKSNDNFIGFKIGDSKQIIASVNVDTINKFVDNLIEVANSLTITEGPNLRNRIITSYTITNKINEEGIKYLRSILSEDDAIVLECIQRKNGNELKTQLTTHFQIIAGKFNDIDYKTDMMHFKLDEIRDRVVEMYNERRERSRSRSKSRSRSRSRDRNARGFKKTKKRRLNKTHNKRT
jgi:hypothetical protein